MAEKDLSEIMKHGVAVVTGLANDGKFVYSGVVHSLIQALRVVHNDGVTAKARIDQLIIDESKALGALRQVRSDLNYMLTNHQTPKDADGARDMHMSLVALINTVTNFLGDSSPVDMAPKPGDMD